MGKVITLSGLPTRLGAEAPPEDPGFTGPGGVPPDLAAHCVALGGVPSSTGPSDSKTGYCTFADGTVCEEWHLYRGECGPRPIGGDCQVVPGCATRKFLIAAGLGAGAGLLLGMLASKRTDVRLVLTGAGAAGGAIARAWMGLGEA